MLYTFSDITNITYDRGIMQEDDFCQRFFLNEETL